MIVNFLGLAGMLINPLMFLAWWSLRNYMLGPLNMCSAPQVFVYMNLQESCQVSSAGIS